MSAITVLVGHRCHECHHCPGGPSLSWWALTLPSVTTKLYSILILTPCRRFRTAPLSSSGTTQMRLGCTQHPSPITRTGSVPIRAHDPLHPHAFACPFPPTGHPALCLPLSHTTPRQCSHTTPTAMGRFTCPGRDGVLSSVLSRPRWCPVQVKRWAWRPAMKRMHRHVRFDVREVPHRAHIRVGLEAVGVVIVLVGASALPCPTLTPVLTLTVKHEDFF